MSTYGMPSGRGDRGLHSWSFLSLSFGEQLVQLVEPLVPERLVAGEPFGCVAKWLGLEVAQPGGRPAGPRDEAGALEHLEVPRDRRLRHRERGGEVPHGQVALGQASEDRPAGWIRERPEHLAELVDLHLVALGPCLAHN